MTIRPVGAELFHTDRVTDGQTDMMNLIVAFRNFANSPKNQYCGCGPQLTVLNTDMLLPDSCERNCVSLTSLRVKQVTVQSKHH
jgi:hypothetical protein